MKALYAELTADVVGTYDQTKTTTQGRITSKTIGGLTVLGPPLNKFVDVFSDAAVTPVSVVHLTSNGRMFTWVAPASGIAVLVLHEFDYSTGSYAYVGKIQFNMPNSAATTQTLRGFKVLDSGTTGWKVFIASVGSIVINGGLFMLNKIDRADFVPIGFPTIPIATTSDAKALYDLQDPSFLGALHTAANNRHVAPAGLVRDRTTNKIYLHNGIAATHQYFVFDSTIAPTITSYTGVTGVAATDVISLAGHPFVNGDQVQFTAISGGTGLAINTVYFVVASVAGVSFQLSLTTGGAAINFTTDIVSGTMIRSFGITGALFSHATGNLPALTGTLLLTDSEDFANPTAVHASINSFDCAFFGTTTNMYMGRLSELTAAAVTWPSLQTCNLLGSANQITAPAALHVAWSNILQRAVYTTNTAVIVIKQFANNTIDQLMGGVNNRYLEALVGNDIVELQTTAIGGIDIEEGWLAILGTTAGQRGYYLHDLRSEAAFGYSHIVTKVLDTPSSVLKFITTLDALYDYTGSLEVYYRTSGFGSISGGWSALPFAEDLSSYASGDQIQFDIYFVTEGLDTSIPAQLNEFCLGYESLNEISDNWEFNYDDSDTGSPSRVSFRLKEAYASAVPTMYFKAYDLSNTLVASHDTSANASFFQYSTDSGANWVALGTIPNTVGTLIRYTFSSPPGVEVRPSLRES